MEIKYISYIPLGLELLAAIIATVYFKKYSFSKERNFVYFLWFTFLVEIAGMIVGKILLINNSWIFNWYMLISFLFFFNWYYSILHRPLFKRSILIFSILFSIVGILSFIFISSKVYHSYTFVLGALFVLASAGFHFSQLLYSDEVLVLKYKLSFWISTALVLFNIGMIPFMLLSEYFNVTKEKIVIILVSLNIILYGCYIVGFIWTKKKYNQY